MPKFLALHTVPAKAFTREQVSQLAQAAQQDPDIRGYRSFFNLSEGKIACVMEGKDRQSVSDWFTKMRVPVDVIVPLELEGERGVIREA